MVKLFLTYFFAEDDIRRGGLFGRDRVRPPIFQLLHLFVELLVGDDAHLFHNGLWVLLDGLQIKPVHVLEDTLVGIVNVLLGLFEVRHALLLLIERLLAEGVRLFELRHQLLFGKSWNVFHELTFWVRPVRNITLLLLRQYLRLRDVHGLRWDAG